MKRLAFIAVGFVILLFFLYNSFIIYNSFHIWIIKKSISAVYTNQSLIKKKKPSAKNTLLDRLSTLCPKKSQRNKECVNPDYFETLRADLFLK